MPSIKPNYIASNIQKTVKNMKARKSQAHTFQPNVDRYTPPRRLKAGKRNKKPKLSVFERLSQSHLVNFNRSDSHCRQCEACRLIRDEIEPYSHLFQKEWKPKKKKMTTNQKFRHYMGLPKPKKKTNQKQTTIKLLKIPNDENKRRKSSIQRKATEQSKAQRRPSHNKTNEEEKTNQDLDQNHQKQSKITEPGHFGIDTKIDDPGIFGVQKISDSTPPQHLDPASSSNVNNNAKPVNFGTKKSSVQMQKQMPKLQSNVLAKPLTANRPLLKSSIRDTGSRPEGESIDSSKFYQEEGESEGSGKDKPNRSPTNSDAQQSTHQVNPSVLAVGMGPTNLDDINEETKSEHLETQDDPSQEVDQEILQSDSRPQIRANKIEGEGDPENSEEKEGESHLGDNSSPDKSELIGDEHTEKNLSTRSKTGLIAHDQDKTPSQLGGSNPEAKDGEESNQQDPENLSQAKGEQDQNTEEEYTDEFNSKAGSKPDAEGEIENQEDNEEQEGQNGHHQAQIQPEAEGEGEAPDQQQDKGEDQDHEGEGHEGESHKGEGFEGEGKDEEDINEGERADLPQQLQEGEEEQSQSDHKSQTEKQDVEGEESQADENNAEGESSEEEHLEDDDKVDNMSIPLSKEKFPKDSVHHDYSEVDSDGEVFELPSNSESFKAGTFIRSSERCCHNQFKEAELAQILFRTRLMIKHREMSMKNKQANPKNIEKKIKKDEEYRPIYPEYPKRHLEHIARKSKGVTQKQKLARLNKGL